MNDDKMTRRFYLLNVSVTVVLLFAILISVYQFGSQAWHGQNQVALIIPGAKENLGWDRSQYLALKTICEESDTSLVLRENVSADYASCKKVVDELARLGIQQIIFTNGCKLSNLENFEKAYPKIYFCTIETISALWTTGRYSILSFEGSYLAGILAGLHTKTNHIGYVAPYSDSEVNQGINAFTMGVQRVNPDAEVLLAWTNSWDNSANEEQAVQSLKARRVDVLTYHQNGDTVPKIAERTGIYFIAYNESYPNNKFCLASIKFDWKKVYGDLVIYERRHSESSTSNISYANGNRNTKHAYGLAKNVVSFETSDKITTREKVLLDTAKWEINHGRVIFSGDIFDRNDVRKCSANESISFQKLQSDMNWLIKGVKIVET